MNDKYYSLIIRTGEAEIRATREVSQQIWKNTLPIIELTRGRKRTVNGEACYPFDSRLHEFKQIFKGQTIAIDLTSELALTCDEIEDLISPVNGYENWVAFLLDLKESGDFKEIIPTLIINAKDDEFEKNLSNQIASLEANFSRIIYRNPIDDDYCYDDLELIMPLIGNLGLCYLLDCGYTAPAAINNVSEKVNARLLNLKAILPQATVCMIASTSFPNNVVDYGDLPFDTFSISEVEIHKRALDIIPGLIYSDYGTINPTRNDNVVMARGWIPRIDVPLETELFYYKKRRPKGITAYSSTYTDVAQQVINDKRFPKELNVWGIDQIRACGQGYAPGSSPSFWISVRMNIHIAQQFNRLQVK